MRKGSGDPRGIGEPHPIKEREHRAPRGGTREPLMEPQGTRDLAARPHEGIQRRKGLLEYHGCR